MEPFKLAKFFVLVLLTWESSARKVTEQSDKKHLVTMVHPKPHQAGKDSNLFLLGHCYGITPIQRLV